MTEEATTNRKVKFIAGSLGAMLLGMFILAGLLIFKKFHAEDSVNCALPEQVSLPVAGFIDNVEDNGKFFLVTLINGNKTKVRLVSIERCTGKTALLSEFSVSPD